MAAGSALMVAPIVWMLSTSLKTEGEVLSATPKWIPDQPTLENYLELFRRSAEFPIARWFANSLGVALAVTLLTLWVTSMAAYAFARLEFKGRDTLFLAVVATMMIPGQVCLIPVYLIAQFIGLQLLCWNDSYPALIVPGLASAFGVFLLRQFFIAIPRELEEAAIVDGAGRWTLYWRVVLPIAQPAMATLAIFTFLASWNDFVWPLIVTSDITMRTLPVGLSIFQGRYTTEYGITMAAAAIASLPVIVAFLFFQRRITEGIALTGLKG